MFEATRSQRLAATSKKTLFAAGVLAAGLAGVGAGAAVPAAHADVIGPVTFDNQTQFDNNFTIVAAQSAGTFDITSGGKLRLLDGGTSGTDGNYAVVKQSDGSTAFNASQITVGTKVEQAGGKNPGSNRRYGPSLFGAQDRSATLQAGGSADGSALAIGLVHDIIPGTPGDAHNFTSLASSPTTGVSGDLNGRIVFTADNIDRVNDTADLTAQYFDSDAPSTAAATVTLPNFDLAAQGLSAVGEVGISRTGPRGKIPFIDNYEVEFTPAAPVPEPASLALLGLGGLTLLKRRRRA